MELLKRGNSDSGVRIGRYDAGRSVAWLTPWKAPHLSFMLSVPYVGCEVESGGKKSYVWADALSDFPSDVIALQGGLAPYSFVSSALEDVLLASLQEKIQRMYPHAILGQPLRRLR